MAKQKTFGQPAVKNKFELVPSLLKGLTGDRSKCTEALYTLAKG
ncbi:hypothetical protein [Pedobacter aquatilis]|nr:hypothetical protein [Pedobacter aquatilis]